MSKRYLTKDDVQKFCTDIALKVQSRKKSLNIHHIVGIVRGGSIPGYLIAQELNLPYSNLTWQTRDNSIKENNANLKELIQEGNNILFVDDINDSGLTLNEIKTFYTNNHNKAGRIYTASLLGKSTSKHITDIEPSEYVTEWVVFPWELE